MNEENRMEDTKLFNVEVERIRNSRIQSNQNITSYQEKHSEVLKQLSDLQNEKTKLMAHVSGLQIHLQNEVTQRTCVQNQIEDMHKLSDEITDYSMQNDKTLELILQKNNTLRTALDKQKLRIDQHIASLQRAKTDKENKSTNLKTAIRMANDNHKDKMYLFDQANQKVLSDVTEINAEISDTQTKLDALEQVTFRLKSGNDEKQNENKVLSQKLVAEQVKLDEATKRLDEVKENDRKEMEEMATNKVDVCYRIQQKDESIRTHEWAIKNQNDFCEKLQHKVTHKSEQNQQLKEKNLQYENTLNNLKADFCEKETRLTNNIATAENAFQTNEIQFANCQTELDELLEKTATDAKISDDLKAQVKLTESSISKLKNEEIILNIKENAVTNSNLLLSSEIETMTTELDELKVKVAANNETLKQTQLRLTEQINATTNEMQQVNDKTEEACKAIHQEINEINKNFEIKSMKDQEEHAEQIMQLEKENYKGKQESAELLSKCIDYNAELETIKKDIQTLQSEINIQKYQQSQRMLQNNSQTNATLLSSRPVRKRDFDELSESSTEGIAVSQAQLRRHLERKKKLLQTKQSKKDAQGADKRSN